MFRILSPEAAAALIPDGACIGINSFLALANPETLHRALLERFQRTGHPRDLTLLCSAGFGCWDRERMADPYAAAGAVRRVIASHYASMPAVTELALENRIEAYCLPLGCISHALRAMAGGQRGYLSRVGLGIFVDPRVHGPGMNARSKEPLVTPVTLDGEEALYYKLPRVDVAFLKGTAVDANGNITFEDEYVTVDALALAQCVRQAGGTVIVQVDRVTHMFSRPRNVVVPGILVDAVVVKEPTGRPVASQTLSGDIHVPPAHMDYWMDRLESQGSARGGEDQSHWIIGRRGAQELRPGDVVNIGIGIPETVGKCASRAGILRELTLTVEARGIGGLPAPGKAFGATIGADMITDMASQFDFYDGGGLDICFMGALEVDRFGNVNAHCLPASFAGVGGFANITSATKTVVFCLNFRAKGLVAREREGRVELVKEGSIPKFKEEITAISFSAREALKNGQRVLYMTERCVFALTDRGLCLREVYPGVRKREQILDLLPFPIVDGTESQEG